MTRTRVFETGMEWNELLLEWTAYVGSLSNIRIVSTQFKSGLYSLEIESTSETTYVYKVLDTPLTQAGVSMHMNHGIVNSTENPVIFSFTSDATVVFRLRWNGSAFQAFCGATQVATGTSVPFAAISAWKHISVDLKLHASAGWVRVYCEGVMVIDYAGQTNQGAADFNKFNVGPTDNQNWSNAQDFYYDDIYLDNLSGEGSPAMNPDRRFYFIGANGNGHYSQWVGIDEDSVDNYLQVDELPQDGDTTRVETDTVDLYDSYQMTTFGIPVGWTLEAIIPNVVAKKDDAGGTLGLQLGTRLDVTDALSSTNTLGTSYSLYRTRQTTKPGGGAWDQASLDDVEVLIKSAT